MYDKIPKFGPFCPITWANIIIFELKIICAINNFIVVKNLENVQMTFLIENSRKGVFANDATSLEGGVSQSEGGCGLGIKVILLFYMISEAKFLTM